MSSLYLDRKPTRRELMQGITRLQNLIGQAICLHGNDRDKDGFEKAQAVLDEAHELCIELRGYDDPTGELPKPKEET